MENIIKFIKSNYIALIIGSFFYVLFLTFTYSGNRMCDCETTEKYNSGQSRAHVGVMRYYHK